MKESNLEGLASVFMMMGAIILCGLILALFKAVGAFGSWADITFVINQGVDFVAIKYVSFVEQILNLVRAVFNYSESLYNSGMKDLDVGVMFVMSLGWFAIVIVNIVSATFDYLNF